MRAILIDNHGDADMMYSADVATPEISPGDVRIRVRAIGVNPADTKWRQGMFQSFYPLEFPHILGYDVAGIIDKVADDVKDFEPGDHVLSMMPKGAYAEYLTAPAASIARMPASLDFARAAALPTPALTGVQLIEESIGLSAGQTVLVTGAVGGVGRYAMYAALQIGAHVIGGVRANQADAALALGAHEIVILDGDDWKGPAFDAVADTIGGAPVEKLCRHLAPNGKIRTVSTTPISPEGLPVKPEFFALHNDPARLTELAQLVADGKLSAPIAKTLPLSQAADAHRAMERGGVGGKIILEP